MKHLNMSISKNKLTALCIGLSLWLVGCGGEGKGNKVSFLPADGQVTLVTATPTSVNAYAAARFLEQASWGPTPASVAEVQRLGIEGWIDQQLAMKASDLNPPNYVIDYDQFNRAAQELAFNWFRARFYDVAVGGNDQLRQRMGWALYNFIVLGSSGQALGQIEYYNVMQRHALGAFPDLIRAVSLDAQMGDFLNNNQNTAGKPNENYARELMQLFTVGLTKLGSDGTILRDAQGKAIETYTQTDVIMATKALSGWQNEWRDTPKSDNINARVPMRPRPNASAHDATQKTLLGKVIPAGQTIQQDLESVISILVSHPNTAPFVSKRLIQSLVSSDPSPEYIARVGYVFIQSSGNLSKVAKAILMDPEARAGDDPQYQLPRIGKIKEPILYQVGFLRALGCKTSVVSRNNTGQLFDAQQNPYRAQSVFGFYAPNHKAPESLTPAPEQKLLTSNEFNHRAGSFNHQTGMPENFANAGCELDLFIKAAEKSDDALIALINERFFKGSMPTTLRAGAKNLLANNLASSSPTSKLSLILQLLVTSPTYGVVK
jgi:uncharacterized protein (DUF1800 family)